MAGMLQIITYLLCVYLVVKGVEIVQIAIMGNRESRRLGLAIGVLSLICCIGAAIFFYNFINMQAASMSQRSESSYSAP
jgi:TRAP-type C4-dicarboxylate transport system permease small subunit